MVTFRSNNNNNNNNRRPPFRSNNNRRPPFRSNNEGSKFSNNDNFRRSVPGRNNHNAVKLIEKYNDLAREALANEDRVLSENYFQHADHFTRVQNEQESIRMARVNSPPVQPTNPIKTEVDVAKDAVKAVKIEEVKKIIPETEIKKVVKTSEKKSAEKKLATI
jgi:5'-3' exonuclease